VQQLSLAAPQFVVPAPLTWQLGGGGEHTPLTHNDVVPLHVVPHVPQLLVFVCSLTQAPLHTLSPLGHAQLPLWQVRPVRHVVPHVPQLLVSVCGSTQCPLHISVQAHVPFRQT
jgi:hypothetical protein